MPPVQLTLIGFTGECLAGELCYFWPAYESRRRLFTIKIALLKNLTHKRQPVDFALLFGRQGGVSEFAGAAALGLPAFEAVEEFRTIWNLEDSQPLLATPFYHCTNSPNFNLQSIAP